jgi:DNA-binding transcriptional LysR family regulator
VERAEAVVADAQGEAKGLVRCSCPLGLVETFSPVFTAFMARYPKVLLQIVAADRAVDLIEERIDVAVRVRLALLTDAALTMRTLGRSARILVAAPAMAGACKDFGDLDGLPTLSSTDQIGERTWSLNGPEGETRTLHHTPRMSCADFPALRLAAASGLGVALLPDHVCTADLESGRLARVLPQWRTDEAIVHLVFTTRRGLPPAVRALIDYLAGAFRQAG